MTFRLWKIGAKQPAIHIYISYIQYISSYHMRVSSSLHAHFVNYQLPPQYSYLSRTGHISCACEIPKAPYIGYKSRAHTNTHICMIRNTRMHKYISVNHMGNYTQKQFHSFSIIFSTADFAIVQIQNQKAISAINNYFD